MNEYEIGGNLAFAIAVVVIEIAFSIAMVFP